MYPKARYFKRSGEKKKRKQNSWNGSSAASQVIAITWTPPPTKLGKVGEWFRRMKNIEKSLKLIYLSSKASIIAFQYCMSNINYLKIWSLRRDSGSRWACVDLIYIYKFNDTLIYEHNSILVW